MPPKAKFSKSEIIKTAFNIVREDGFPALTARALATRLGSSARPIFTVFESMEDVQQAVLEAAKKLYSEYVEQGLSMEQAFKGVGIQYIRFAVEEPKLFQLLFMSEQETIPNLSGVLPVIEQNYENILLSVQNDYGIDETAAQNLYRHLWIYSHGIATLCAMKVCHFTDTQIEEMLKEVCISLLKNRKAGKEHD